MAVKVGIQLFSVAKEMKKDPVKAIEEVVKIGYKNLEVANHNAEEDYGVGFGVSSDELNRILKEFGAKVIGAHVAPVHEGNIRQIIGYHSKIGNPYIIKASDYFDGYDDTVQKAKQYNKLGELCAEHGMKFIYHNHVQEFQVFNGKEVLDILLENTDGQYVGFELDTFWAMRSGKDPVELMNHLGGRLTLVHQKDFSKDAKTAVNLIEQLDLSKPMVRGDFQALVDPADFCEIGTGVMDIQSIIDTANKLHVEYIILEQDQTQHEQMESIQISMDNFKKFCGIDF